MDNRMLFLLANKENFMQKVFAKTPIKRKEVFVPLKDVKYLIKQHSVSYKTCNKALELTELTYKIHEDRSAVYKKLIRSKRCWKCCCGNISLSFENGRRNDCWTTIKKILENIFDWLLVIVY